MDTKNDITINVTEVVVRGYSFGRERANNNNKCNYSRIINFSDI